MRPPELEYLLSCTVKTGFFTTILNTPTLVVPASPKRIMLILCAPVGQRITYGDNPGELGDQKGLCLFNNLGPVYITPWTAGGGASKAWYGFSPGAQPVGFVEVLEP